MPWSTISLLIKVNAESSAATTGTVNRKPPSRRQWGRVWASIRRKVLPLKLVLNSSSSNPKSDTCQFPFQFHFNSGLGRVDLPVQPFLGDQVGVTAALHDPAALEHQDQVGDHQTLDP